MAITKIEGFKIYSNLDGTRSIIIDPNRIEESLKVYIDYKLEGVAITTAHGYNLKNVDFLYQYPNIINLSISDGIQDIKGAYALRNLEKLILSGPMREVDFSSFTSLRELRTDWSPKLYNLSKCNNLKVLHFEKFNPKSKNCSTIADLIHVRNLQLNQSTISSLSGLENFRLENFEISYSNQINSLCCLDNSIESLSSLQFNSCKGIVNHDYVSRFKQLKILAYNRCGTIQSIKFIERMNALQSFRLVGTDVADGDMSPGIRLKFLGFNSKKHFSHTFEEIKALQDLHS